MSNIYLSFRDWPYQYIINQQVKCAWSEFDFFAYAIGNTIAILTNDNGKYSPIFMWSPFESEISCIEWMNGSLSTSINRPILAIASQNSRLIFLNVATASFVTSLTFKNEQILSLKFSATTPNHLYIGFESGVLIYAKLSLDKSQHYEAIKTNVFKHPINFITFDLLFESTIAAASEDGKFSIIHGDKIIDNYDLGEKINSFNFYPENNNFIVISTPSRTVLFAISEMTVINFMCQPNVLQVYFTNNRVIIAERDRLSLYRSVQKIGWEQKSEVTVSSLRIETSFFLDNKIMMITSPLQLYQVEVIRDKLFVTKHCSLLNSRPVDWSFYKGSIALSTNQGYLYITAPTAEACPSNLKSPRKKKEGESEVTKPTENSDSNGSSYKIGNSCSFIRAFEVGKCPMRVKWISDSLLILWSQTHRRIVTVDLVNKAVKDLVPFLFLKDNYTLISQVIVAPNKAHICVVINNQTAILISCPDLSVVSLIALKEISIGTFYYDSTLLFFVGNSSNLYIYDMQGKLISTRAFTYNSNVLSTELTTITCTESGSVYIGDIKGGVYKFAKKYYSVKRIFQNSAEFAVIPNESSASINSNNDSDAPLFDIANLFNFGNKNQSSAPGSPSKTNFNSSIHNNNNISNNNENNNNGNGGNSIQNPFAISKITQCGKFLLIVDHSGRGFTLHEDSQSTYTKIKIVAFPSPIENYKYASDSTLLAKFSHHKRISAFSLKGKYAKRRSPSWYRNKLLNEDLRNSNSLKTVDDFISAGIQLVKQLFIYNRNSCNKQTKILINTLIGSTKLNNATYPLALMSGNYAVCKKILKKTSPKAPNFLWNISTLALFDLEKPGESLKDSIQILKDSGNFGCCYELLMVTKASKILIDLMVERKDYKGAFYYIRNQPNRNNSLKNCEESINNLTNLLELKNPMAPIILMAQLGMFNEICVYITRLPFDNALKNDIIKFIHQTFIENQ